MCAFPRVRIVSGGPVAEGGWRARGTEQDAAEGRQKDTDMAQEAEALVPPFLRSLGARARARSNNLLARSVCVPPATCHLGHVLFLREYESTLL